MTRAEHTGIVLIHWARFEKEYEEEKEEELERREHCSELWNDSLNRSEWSRASRVRYRKTPARERKPSKLVYWEEILNDNHLTRQEPERYRVRLFGI